MTRPDEEEDEYAKEVDEDDDYDDDDGENLNPLASLMRLAKSTDFHDGEMVIRSIHETLQYVIDSPKDINAVLEVMKSLATNNEPILRTDLMEQVPQIAFLCHDHPDKLGGLVTGNLVPMVVKFLTDPNDLVRKTSQAALLVLLEQELVSHKDVDDQVCPVILDLTESDAIDYFKTEAVALMSKMAPLVGREMTERLFVQRFTRLCSDTLFQVRKVCAANFGEFSGVVGSTSTENVLLHYFFELCKDGVWSVRKACADVFTAVSCACSLHTRKSSLSPLFVSLLSDESRWVRLAAFQNLGPFISIFADPNVTGLHYNDEGILYIGPPPQSSEDSTPLDADNIVTACSSNSQENETEDCDVTATTTRESNEWSDLCLENTIHIENSSLDHSVGNTIFRDNENGGSVSSDRGGEEEEICIEGEVGPESFQKFTWSELTLEEAVNGSPNTEIRFESSPFKYTEPTVDSCENCFKQPDTVPNDMVPHLASVVAFGDVDHTEPHSTGDMETSAVHCCGVVDDLEQPSTRHGDACDIADLESACHGYSYSVENPDFNEINYWKVPLPELDLDFLKNLTIEDDVISEAVTPPLLDLSIDLFTTSAARRFDMNENDGNSPIKRQLYQANNVDNGGKVDNVSVDNVNVAADDVQAELEALAASLAESIFCNEHYSEGSERMGLNRHTDDGPLFQFSNFRSDGKSQEEPQKSTYAQVCAKPARQMEVYEEKSQGSQPESDTDDSNDREIEMENFDSGVSSDEETGESGDQTGEHFDPDKCNSLLGKYDYSKSLHNLTTFSNLSSSIQDSKGEGDSSPEKLYNIWSPERSRAYRDSQKPFWISINVNQDIVPKTLLEHYISMTDPMRAETVDDEITRHCAYSLPAVALTLGRKYWSVLRETYEKLASDLHWKVRRTLAFSIHELAHILGEDLAEKDLLPVFEGFIKDLDEVRIGVLKNLAHFLKVLPHSQRKLFLPRINEFLTHDNVNNWRFRLELVMQLVPIADLFDPHECWMHIFPITFDLMADKVVEIRRTSIGVISQLARMLMNEGEGEYMVPFSAKMIEQFAQGDTWTKRQTYAYLVGQLIKDSSVTLDVVCSLFLPSFLALSRDKVPNIRLLIAKIINSNILVLDYFQDEDLEAVSNIRETIQTLQKDNDKDVQYFASYQINTELCENRDLSFY